MISAAQDVLVPDRRVVPGTFSRYEEGGPSLSGPPVAVLVPRRGATDTIRITGEYGLGS